MKNKSIKKIVQNISLSVICATALQATTLRDAIENTINTNPDIIAEHYNNKSYKTNIEEQQRDYYPTLDLAGYLEKSETHNNPDVSPPARGTAKKDGWNVSLKFEQVLYDGGLTPNEVEKYKEAYNNIRYVSNDTIEDIIAEIVSSYLDLLLNDSLIAIDNIKLESHDRYLELAKSQEKVTGEILDRLQVESKITAIMDNYLDQLVQKQKSLSTFKKLSGKKITGNICKPNIDEKLIPSTIEEAIDKALRNNNAIRAQKATIKQQQATVRIVEAKFRPDLKFQVQGDWDDDLRLPENGRQDIYRVRLQSDWNLYVPV